MKGNKKGTLIFTQTGAKVTFQGKDIENSSEMDLFNFKFSTEAPHKTDMLSAVKNGQKAFVYSFAYHGELPGMATFSIETDIAEGTGVNVYLFDAGSGKFSKIAGNISVGAQGLVTYKNNTMSEYLITTQTLSGENVKGGSPHSNSLQDNFPLIIAVAAAVILIAAAAVIVYSMRKKSKKPLQM